MDCASYPPWPGRRQQPTESPTLAPGPLPLTLLLEHASLDKFKGQKDSPLLLQGGGVWGHGAWGDAPDVGVVPTAGHIEHRSSLTRPKHLGAESSSQLCGLPAPLPGPRQRPSPA